LLHICTRSLDATCLPVEACGLSVAPLHNGQVLYALISEWARQDVPNDAALAALRRLSSASPPAVYRTVAGKPAHPWGARDSHSDTLHYVWPDVNLSVAELNGVAALAERISSALCVTDKFTLGEHWSPVTIWGRTDEVPSVCRSQGSTAWRVFLFADDSCLPVTDVAAATAAMRLKLRLLSGPLQSAESTIDAVRVLPLPFVWYPGADGRLFGMALCAPSEEVGGSSVWAAVDKLERALGWGPEADELIQLDVPRHGRVVLRRMPGHRLLHPCVRPEMWRRASRVWISVTPAITTRGASASGRCSDQIRRQCVRTGWPVKRVYVATPVCPGVARAVEYTGPAVERFERQHITVELTRPVAGPFLLGEGAELGLGLMLPIDHRGPAHSGQPVQGGASDAP
jgi:hypothetical protein